MTDWVIIDGAMGEGGGQVLRSALSLSLLTGRPLKMEKVRARRKTPGLLRQHMTALQAAAEVGHAKVTGGRIGSTEITFEPSELTGGQYRFAVASAGSATLVFQTILPPLMFAKSPSTLMLEGGTHNPQAPPFDFLQTVYLPLLRRMGAQCDISLERYGFYPLGGGLFTAHIKPINRLTPIDLVERGEMLKAGGRALVAKMPRSIVEKEAIALSSKLEWPPSNVTLEEIRNSPGQGNVLMVRVDCANVTELFTAFGDKAKQPEDVAEDAALQTGQYLSARAVAGPHLADQLLLPFALAGAGSFTALPLTLHATTNIEVIRKFLNVYVRVESTRNSEVLVRVSRT